MSKKIPQKIPGWLATFADFAKDKERKREVRDAIDVFNQLLTKHWEAFREKTAPETEERPKKKRNVDPIKNLGKAMDKVAERVEEAKDNKELMKQYQDRVKSVVPEQMKPVLSALVGDVPMGSGTSHDLSRLMDQTAQGLYKLAQVTQRVLTYANVNQSDAEVAVQSLDQVTHHIEELRESLKV